MKYTETDRKILLVGIGNGGRGDDGLGWKFADNTARKYAAGIDVEYRYQLQVEDAALIGEYDLVIFADASYEQFQHGYMLIPCPPDQQASFTSHALAPGAIVYLANQLFNRYPVVWLMAITGSEWELGAPISEDAERNLTAALQFFESSFLSDVPCAFTDLPDILPCGNVPSVDFN